MAKPWHEDDAFWDRMAPIMFTERRWTQTVDEIDGLVVLLGLQPRLTVLDLACGPGRHSIELTRRGYRVTGVDRTAQYLAEARSAAADAGVEVEFVEADMREFIRPAGFDLVVNMYTSFGYFRDAGDDQLVLKNIFTSLRPGGRIVLDLKGKEVVAREFRSRDWRELDDGSLLLEERTIEKDWSWIRNRWMRLHGTERDEFTIEHRLYSAAELQILLGVVGFRGVECFGSFRGDPYDERADRLLVTAMKGDGLREEE
ncbi:MAG: class I SAM-dependent methyltransferase [Phycisphaerales bacterium]